MSLDRRLRRKAKSLVRPIRRWIHLRRDLDALYALLYRSVHDLDQALPLASIQTRDTFAHQWSELREGEAMLSDAWFRDNVARILSEEEIQIRADWFRGKKVLDCGCGGGRWSHGFAELGAEVTAVDVNQAALDATREVFARHGREVRLVCTPLERLDETELATERFDLAFSWGVLHHCASFTGALAQIARLVRQGGLLYLYLYGRESLSFDEDLDLFRQRVRYNALDSAQAREAFLLARVGGDRSRLHQVHDQIAPLLNRRLDFATVEKLLAAAGLGDVVRTIDHTELFVRAVRGDARDYHDNWFLPPRRAPYWFQRYG